jgi:hypothetical protein
MALKRRVDSKEGEGSCEFENLMQTHVSINGHVPVYL